MAAYVRRVRIFVCLEVFLLNLLFCGITNSVEIDKQNVVRVKRAAVPPVNNVNNNQNIGGAGRFDNQGRIPKGNMPQVPQQAQQEGARAQPKPGFFQQGNVKAKNIMLSDQPACQEDVSRLCSAVTRRNNFAVLDCLQGDLDVEGQVSEDCQHLIWSYKHNLTRDDRFESAGKEVCHNDFEKIPECKNLVEGTGTRIPCLIEHMENISDPACHQFLIKMASIVFSDYRLVWHFMDHCQDDIQTFNCGRLENREQDEKMHNQGKTIICLAGKITQLNHKCKKQVLRVAELQSDDYHLDRPLYYACRQAREDVCETVHAGAGKVFECLYKNKNNPKVSEECKKMLTIRQQLMAEDVKVEKTFFTECQQDMQNQGCFNPAGTTDGTATRTRVLLCLENALKKDQKLSPTCVAEMTEMRRELMEDYQISPEIVERCEVEISKYCGNGLARGGKTLHCLMESANPLNQQRKNKKVHPSEPIISPQCRAALEDLLKEADIEEDFTVDQVLADACAPVLETECKDMKHSGVINCLMEKIDSDHMTDECEDRLLEIQYFIVRDFVLGAELYKQCHKDAVELCHASDDWAEVNQDSVSNSPTVFSCLYRHIKDEADEDNNSKDSPVVSRKCAYQVKRAMRKRAKRIDLEPEIEDACLPDLGAFCSNLDKYEKGKEIMCLQDNMESLSDKCQDAIREFTEDEDVDLDLDTILMRACTPMIKRFCGELLEHDAQASAIMDCLIEYKNHHEMNHQCAAGVEHHQIIQLQDFKFTHKFKEACKKDVIKNCKDKTKKTDIIVCLSEIVREDVLTDKDPRISETCKQQLRVEVLQRGETIELDPELKEACTKDVKQYCAMKKAGNAEVIECLRSHQKELSSECHKMIFKREQVEVAEGADFQLFRDCKKMIKNFCSGSDAKDVVDCLKKNRNSPNFDSRCRVIVMRRVLQETKDYRLNPSLAKSCRLDIPKFCKSVVDEQKNDEELEGKVINCLKIEFIKKRLSRDCHVEIQTLVQESHMDINMDPVLMHACMGQIKQYCSKEIQEHEQNSNRLDLEFLPSTTGDQVEECLEQKLMDGKIDQKSACGREISRIVEEAHVDVNVDPQLYSACLHDLTRWCQDIEAGEGKKMSCLLTILEDYPDKMRKQCSTLLVQRKTLWEYAAQYAPAESLTDLSSQIMQSNSKTYLLGVLMTIVGIIFIVGITCGRVTKRVTRENKTK